MPFINIAVAGTQLSEQQKQTLIVETTRQMSEIMGKNPNLTSVRIDEFPPATWGVAGTRVSDTDHTAVHTDIKVTAGTNTEDEKARMIEAAVGLAKDVVGSIPEATYVVIHELDAASWGYNGKTQASRR